MATVTVTGWQKGLNKVELNRRLRQHTGSGLSAAKRAVDRLLAGERLKYEFPDAELAFAFCKSLSEAGADYSITEN
jgi:hypothetical protein